MESNIKENQITFSKGMSNIPSDNLCDDNCLSDCVGLRMKDGELKPIRSGVKIGDVIDTTTESDGTAYSEAETVLYVHKHGEYTHLIAHGVNREVLIYHNISDRKIEKGVDIGQDFVDVPKISSIGNILIVQSNTIRYFKWETDQYTELGELPHLSFDMRPKNNGEEMDLYDAAGRPYSDSIKKIVANMTPTPDGDGFISGTEFKNRSDETVALIEGAYKLACKQNLFTFPFFMRIGLRLYDGSVTRLTPPFLVLPTVRGGAYVHRSSREVITNSKVGMPYDMPTLWSINRAVAYFIKITKDGDLSKFGELIRSVVVYMTNPVKTYETDSVTYGDKYRSFTNDPYDQDEDILDDWIDANGAYHYISVSGFRELNDGTFLKEKSDGSTIKRDWYWYPPSGKPDKVIIKELLNSGVFYKLAEIDINDAVFGEYKSISGYIGAHVLENITTQEQLEHDDYYGNAMYYAGEMYAYNSRLNLANVRRFPYAKAKDGMQKYVIETSTEMQCNVYIQAADSVVKVRCGNVTCPNSDIPPFFFFYPDPKAKAVEFINGDNHYYKKLSVHPRLNGAYYFLNLPWPIYVEGVSFWGGIEWGDNLYLDDNDKLVFKSDDAKICKLKEYSSYETLPNEILTSEVNNPFVFNAEGDNVVGTGKIIGIVANTVAISQGQFGQYPLIVFTMQGIYALYVNSTGLYSSSAPLSREVCNNPESITPTDGAVFFTSDKGLMRMVGSEIVCVSSQMMGKKYTKDKGIDLECGTSESFIAYLKGCKIGYDYKEKCLHIINPSYAYHYVLDISSSAITRCKNISDKKYNYVLGNYPDSIVEDEAGNVYSFINKPDINEDTNSYDGILLSRPIKFGNAQMLKSLRQVLHVDDIHSGASVTLHVYVSNNLKDWGELKSLRGMGWKYFRFGLSFSRLSATDSYSGLLAITQGRRTDKLR